MKMICGAAGNRSVGAAITLTATCSLGPDRNRPVDHDTGSIGIDHEARLKFEPLKSDWLQRGLAQRCAPIAARPIGRRHLHGHDLFHGVAVEHGQQAVECGVSARGTISKSIVRSQNGSCSPNAASSPDGLREPPIKMVRPSTVRTRTG